METFEEFGGKNKARRLAKAIQKGKTAKAERLAKKVNKKVQKLIDKGKTSKKRYTFLSNTLRVAGEEGLSIKELEEVETITDDATVDDPTFDSELKEAEDDVEDGTVATGENLTKSLKSGTWIPKVPNWVTIIVPIVTVTTVLLIAFRKKIFK